MRAARVLAATNPYLAIVGMALMVAMLVGVISLTTFDTRWVIFLGGVLAAAVLAFVSHSANARWVIARRTSQLSATRAKLATEARLRAHAEESLARMRGSEYIDQALPAMLVYVDTEERVRYHNQAFTRFTGVEDNAIDGKTIAEIIGAANYAETEAHLREALRGRDAHFERNHTLGNGDISHLQVQYLSHHAQDGKVAGLFAILTDITRVEDLVAAPRREAPREAPRNVARTDATDAAGAGERLVSALEHDEFTLFSQAIAPLGPAMPGTSFCEVLLRMKEEEEKFLPPGTFLPLAEELGLMHEVDRWVVRHVVEFASGAGARDNAVYFVNVAAATIVDPAFALFVRERLKASRVPDHTLCFELPEADVLGNPQAYRDFIAALDGTGVQFAVSGFGCNPLAMRLLAKLRVDFVKLDGGIVFNMLASPEALAKVKAINRIAHSAGIRTIAECVESDEMRAALARIETDFAQGFGIGRPAPLHRPDKAVPDPDSGELAAAA